jgi:hypothetical protein
LYSTCTPRLSRVQDIGEVMEELFAEMSEKQNSMQYSRGEIKKIHFLNFRFACIGFACESVGDAEVSVFFGTGS